MRGNVNKAALRFRTFAGIPGSFPLFIVDFEIAKIIQTVRHGEHPA